MQEQITKLCKTALSDERFMLQLAVHAPAYSGPSFFRKQKLKTTIAMMYMGFLIAKNEYKETDYE